MINKYLYTVYIHSSLPVSLSLGVFFYLPQNESCDANHGGTNMAITAVKTPTVPRDKWLEEVPRPKKLTYLT